MRGGPTAKPIPPNPRKKAWRAKSNPPGITGGLGGHRAIVIIVEGGARLGEGGDHEAVPVGEDLVVLERVDPLLANLEETRADALQSHGSSPE